jgi:hypothetical protein
MRSRVQTSAGWSFLVAMAVLGDEGGLPSAPPPPRGRGWP